MRNIPPINSESLAFHSLLINAIPGNNLVLLPDAPTFTIVAVSQDYLTALKLQREPLLGCGLFEVFFSDGRNQAAAQQLRQSLTQVVETKQPQSITNLRYERSYFQTYLLEGSAWRVANKPVIGPQGELLYIINTVEDITTEVQLVEAAQANRYLQTIINLFKEPMQVLQPVEEQDEIIDFRFTLTNQAYAAYANSTPERLAGKRVSEVFPGYKETASFSNPVETYKTGKPLTFEIHYDQDGLDLYNLMSTAKLGEEVVIHFTDFTHLRHLQLQLESKIRELNGSNQSLQEFAYVASHDLQEPLRKIQSFGDLLASQYADALGDGAAYVHRMQTAATRMSVLIRDLLDYSRLSTRPDQTTPVSLTDVLAVSLADLDLLIEETGAQVTVDSLPTVLGDLRQLGQLFQNLLSNALKFRRVDIPSRIEVRYRLVRGGELTFSGQPSQTAAAYHLIEVSDNGIGFEEQYRDRIFQVFQRLHGKNEFTGTGIGLAICEKVVTNHGGVITASSQPGQGATFSIYLPA
ncbi:sensor histidine kinase [Spirosoma linguale]|uniref:histidine kinase n=1 Tax=Spirosoma linguale (strain ATCC 33905 / DSM 74 / LMG 10896 / Claus 1) TaxID=504472 RepID=D2QDS1_SPILD|nr:histidine kinase [Spirosoma linguale DSM 74]